MGQIQFFFIICLALASGHAFETEHIPASWLFEDGWITKSEQDESVELEFRALYAPESTPTTWTASIRTTLDTSGPPRKPSWALQGLPSHWHLEAAGDSNIRSWLCAWKTKKYQFGVGDWKASDLGLDWPIQGKMGAFLGFHVRPMEFALGIARDSLALASTRWTIGHGTQIGLGFLQFRNQSFWLFEPRSGGFDARFWLPQERNRACIQLLATRNLQSGLRAKLRYWISTGNHTDSILQITNRERKSQVLLNSTLQWKVNSWRISLEERYRKPWDSIPEWFVGALVARTRNYASLLGKIGMLEPGLGTSVLQGRLSAKWSWKGRFPWILGALQTQWRHASAPRTQLETGLLHEIGTRAQAELLWVIPADYRETGRARIRGSLFGPISIHQNLQMHWSLDEYYKKKPPLCNPKGEFIWSLRL